jgi:hypothetical protein
MLLRRALPLVLVALHELMATAATAQPGAPVLANQAQLPGAQAQVKSAVQRYPLTVLVINRETRETYAYPSAGVSAFLSDPVTIESAATFGPNSKFLPVPDLPKALATKAEINSLAAPLAARSALYAQTVLRGLAPLNLTSSTPWTVAALKVIGRTRAFTGAQDPAQPVSAPAWPLSVPLSMTQLGKPDSILGAGSYERALLVVIECRSDSAAGAVEQLDFIAFGGPQMTRTYWSRDTHDPTYFKRTDDAIAQVSEKFRQRLSRATNASTNGENSETSKTELATDGDAKVLIEVSRSVSETIIPDVQRVLKTIAPQAESLLIPVGVDRDFIRYSTPVSSTDFQKLKEALVALPRQQERFAITTATAASTAAESSKDSAAASGNGATQRLQVPVLQLVPPVKAVKK